MPWPSTISSAARRLGRRPALQRESRLARPAAALAALAAAQLLAVGALALVVRHNGWLFFQGGDQTFYSSAAWVFAHGHIPKSSSVGHAWPYVLAPFSRAAGPNPLVALPAVVLFQVLLLLPLALWCVYSIAASVAQRGAGLFVAGVYVAAPFAAIPLWAGAYHTDYVEQFLPQAHGLTGMGDFPSMVCLLVAGALCVRALDGSTIDGALAGLVAGFAIGIKPANALFLGGVVLAFAAARRVRAGGAFAAALLPALVTLALWKYRGLGYLPLFESEPEALAAGSESAVGTFAPGRYLDLDLEQLRANYSELRGLLGGATLLQFLPLLGLVAVARRSLPKALLLAGWSAAFVLVKASSDVATLEGGTLLRLLLPALPPLLILTALAPLVVVRPLRATPPVSRSWDRRALAAVAVVIALLPLVLVATFPPLRERTTATYAGEGVMTAVDREFRIAVDRQGRGVRVDWRRPSSPGVDVFYRVFRSRPRAAAPDPSLPPGRDGIRCRPRRRAAAVDCWLEMEEVAETRSTVYVETRQPGSWVYRVGLVANWRDDRRYGDLLLLSPPARLGPR